MTGKLASFTLDLEPDNGSVDSHEVLLNRHLFGQFEAFLANNRIKLTTFVVGKMLEEQLEVAERFTNIDNEFELHSYSHDADNPDSEDEITKGISAYKNYFGCSPRGYRAPNGAISATGLSILHREGILYDASIFPSWRPELGYNFSHLPCTPWFYEELPGLVELPFATVPGARMVISLSFVKLFGFSFYRALFRIFGLPNVVVIDSHLYDYFATSPVRDRSRFDWKRYALLRNIDNTIGLAQQLHDYLVANGYTFVSMSDLYDRVKNQASTVPVISATQLGRNGRSNSQ